MKRDTQTALKRTMLALSTVGLSWLSGCSLTPTAPTGSQPVSKPDAQPGTQPGPPPSAPTATRPATNPVPVTPVGPGTARPVAPNQGADPLPSPGRSSARNAKEYRKDAATHLYARHGQHIYKGRLPPMLEGVGVLNVDIDRSGLVKSIHWMRAPRHAPQVMQQIERMVRAAAPYPLPLHMNQVTYTDVWLWHKSGKFQLDTLTEGQD